MSKFEQSIGKQGEELAAQALRALGVEMVERIGTPVILEPAPGRPGKRQAFFVTFGEKVSADRMGIIPGTGRRVLAEVKTIMDRNLCWSDLRPHQPDRLTMNADFGGLSLLVWVHSSGVYVLRWPIPGFGRGKSITPQTAERLRLETL